jgi:hypothetical protein
MFRCYNLKTQFSAKFNIIQADKAIEYASSFTKVFIFFFRQSDRKRNAPRIVKTLFIDDRMRSPF